MGTYGQPNTTLPILTLDDGEDGGFDYADFIEDQQNINYLTTESPESGSSSGSGLPINTPSPSSASSDASLQALTQHHQHQQQLSPLMPRPGLHITGGGVSSSSNIGRVFEGQVVPKPRLERRGHTKSRRGCFNCKRRRIKVRLIIKRDGPVRDAGTDRITTFMCVVSRDETCMWTLREAGAQMRVPHATNDCASGTYEQYLRFTCANHVISFLSSRFYLYFYSPFREARVNA